MKPLSKKDKKEAREALDRWASIIRRKKKDRERKRRELHDAVDMIVDEDDPILSILDKIKKREQGG